MDDKLAQLKTRLQEIEDLANANAVLGWDQNTYLPVGGAEARGSQMATLGRIIMEKSTADELGKLIDGLLPLVDSLPPESDDAALIRVAKLDFDRNTRIPPDFYARFLQHTAASFQTWTDARPRNDFQAVEGMLEKTLEYSRQMAEFFPGYEHIADPLIDFADHGMKVSSVRQVFNNLRTELVPLVESIRSQPPIDDACLKQYFAVDDQLEFAYAVIREMGYDFNRGRSDKAPHPFTTRFSIGDVRITTRVREDDLGEAFFSTVHEAGHAMYEQGVNPLYEGLPLAAGTSAGVHESQSRLWENVVGRSLPFWQHYYPLLQERFPLQLTNVSLETFYKAINKVQPSLIRTDADEVTYNLHIMIRFDLELEMLEGRLKVKELPEAWNERYHSDIGIRPTDDRNGCMQDVHWYSGPIGGSFQGYTLGNIMSGLFYQKALDERPTIKDEIAQGTFSGLHGWMRDHIYTFGRKYSADELIKRITGGLLDIAPYIAYLKGKYESIYHL
jgi:carboxypeptidase Taq